MVEQTVYDDHILQKWYFTTAPGERVPVLLLRPLDLRAPAPAIIALHCHGGMYFFGKKKLVADESDPQYLLQYRQELYEGKAIADELVQRGYIVAVIDSFYFGERRLVVPPPEAIQKDFLLAAEGSDQWLHLIDRVSIEMEHTMAKSLFWAGMCWPGILAWDDSRTVDFLLTRPEVDPTRIGCVGLSMGGERAALLGAVDPRVKAVCVVGWMSTLAEMLEQEVAGHSWACFIPGQTRYLDWPDLAAIHAPDPLLVMQGSRDPLFPLQGYQRAAERLRAIYAKAGVPGSLDIGVYDVPHTFSTEMQQHAWAFFEKAFGENTSAI
jgi:dienelactone hydrolase